MTVVGVDLSTFAVHTAWIDGRGQPRRWHVQLGTPRMPIMDRVRAVHMTWPADVEEIAIEYPFGRSRSGLASMMAVVGAVTKSAPSYCRVSWPSSGDLRRAIGARDNKVEAHDQVRIWIAAMTERVVSHWDEHELDALVACVGWMNILAAQEETA